jgi:PiT family inorganic phosphate transporter
MIFLLFSAACFLAFSNGANDNFKGVATLFGTGTANYKVAIRWATFTTFTGSLAALFLASVLVKNFSGKGLVPDTLLQGPEFAIAVALGAALTVFIATRVGMPVSTTHSLVGALFGSGVVAIGTSFDFVKLGSVFLIPLLVSPLLAGGLSLLFYPIFSRLRSRLGFSTTTCVCVGKQYVPLSALSGNGSSGGAIAAISQPLVVIEDQKNCVEVYQGSFLGFSMQGLLDGAHFISAGVVSFARGLNDTPKIVGLLLVINAQDIRWGIGAIAGAIAVGGLLNAKSVGLTMGKKITRMNHGQGLTANLITGLLVTTASVHGLPVSTTHVSVGSIFGVGAVTRKVNFRVVKNILWSWVLTLPVAALLSGMVYGFLRHFIF